MAAKPGTARPDEAPTAPIADLALRPLGWRWLLALGLTAALTLLLGYLTVELFVVGVGVWGTNIPYVWGFDLINYTWWISIANAASLIAVILVLRRHSLRTAVNRFAEGAALFAVICAGLFPVLHLGRPWLFYWVFPYPATYEVWPQFRSPLIWDFWSIMSHIVITALFWYVGLIPDLATLRDRARGWTARRVFGLFALGWRGSARQWYYHQLAYRGIAGLIVPLILVMQSVVSFEFAVTVVPDWHQTRLPAHFIVTALVSGLATVLLIALLLRRSLRLEAFITDDDVAVMTKLLLASSLVLAYSYADEAVMAWLGDRYAREGWLGRVAGDFALVYWGALACAVAAPQALWSARVRASFWPLVTVAVLVNVGAWLDRFSIVVGGLARDYLPSAWRDYAPTLDEWTLLLGTVGLFSGLLLLFVRYLPVVTMFETKHAERERD